MMVESRIDNITLFGRNIYILRDDLLGDFNGNKARKLEYLLNSDLSKFDKIVSYGSSQSNAMYSLSLFAKMKNLPFYYVSNHISKNLLDNPCGNFKFSIDNGMNFYTSDNKMEFLKSLIDDKTLFIKEGVAQSEAELGFITQANTIKKLINNDIIDIFLPSGTGASAGFLAKNIDLDVYTTPCVGDINYLKLQISYMMQIPKNLHFIAPPKKFHFGKLYKELYEIWDSCCDESGVEFDLIYDPVGLITLRDNIDKFKRDILYIHQGGLLGNISQLKRYQYKFRAEFCSK